PSAPDRRQLGPALFPYTTSSDLPDRQAGTDLGELGRLLQDGHPPPDPFQGDRGGQATDAAAGDDRGADHLPSSGIVDMETPPIRSEEHTSELQSRENLVCRLLLE